MQPPSVQPFHLQVRAARRAAHLSQTELAERAGCNQSQLSAFEAGVRGKVSRETIAKVAELLGLEAPDDDAAAAVARPVATPAALARCPDFACPSNLPYFAGDRLLFLPLGTAGAGAHCALCGEVLVRACPHCGAPILAHGGCCGSCGLPLVEIPEGAVADPRAWAEARRAAAVELRAAFPRA